MSTDKINLRSAYVVLEERDGYIETHLFQDRNHRVKIGVLPGRPGDEVWLKYRRWKVTYADQP